MKRCPITYEPIAPTQKYSRSGLKNLSYQLQTLQDLPLSAQEQRAESQKRFAKMSIQGVQPKLSAKLRITQGCFEITDVGGTFILKPQHEFYEQLPENEALTMRLATMVGIEVPVHGLVYAADGSWTYFIKRFDRHGHHQKVPVEDFAQLSSHHRSTKYNSTMEQLVDVLEKFCTFPLLEKRKLLIRTLFNFLVGNEDMHLKNFSLITRQDKVEFSPAYDFLNTTIALQNPQEEIALPLRGKKNKLKRADFIQYFAQERLRLNEGVVQEVLAQFSQALSQWQDLMEKSFLSEDMKEAYGKVLKKRSQVLQI